MGHVAHLIKSAVDRRDPNGPHGQRPEPCPKHGMGWRVPASMVALKRLTVSHNKPTSRQPTHLEREIVSQAESIDTQSTHLRNIDVSNNFLVHIYEGAALRLAVEHAKGCDKVNILGGTSDRGAGNDGRFG